MEYFGMEVEVRVNRHPVYDIADIVLAVAEPWRVSFTASVFGQTWSIDWSEVDENGTPNTWNVWTVRNDIAVIDGVIIRSGLSWRTNGIDYANFFGAVMDIATRAKRA